jgi:hypothetical protein
MNKLDSVRDRLIRRRQKIEAAKRARIERIFESQYKHLQEQAAQHAKPWGSAPGGVGYESDSPHDDDVKAHDVKVGAFRDDLARKTSIRRVLPGGDAQDMKSQPRGQKEALSRLLRAVDAQLKRTRDAKTAKVLKGVRSAASLLRQEAMGGRSELNPVMRKRAMKLLTAYAKTHDRGLGLGNNTSKIPRGLQSDAASGEIAGLLKDTEENGYSFAGRAVGMARGDGLYESAKRTFTETYVGEPEMGDAAPPGSMLTKEETNFRYASDPLKSCGNCEHFVEPAGCKLVMGMILKTNVCDRFAPEGGKESMRSANAAAEAAIEKFREGYSKPGPASSEAERKVEGLKRRLARELRAAKTEAERREAQRRYKAGLRRANEQEFEGFTRTRREESEAKFTPLPKHNPDDRREEDAGD